MRQEMRAYLFRVFRAADRFWNAVFGGDPRMTISQRAGLAQLKGARWACVLCRVLDVFDKDHCATSVSDPHPD